jgi:hypothetical protein
MCKPEIVVYLGSASDELLDIANYLKRELPHINIKLKPLTELKNEKCTGKTRQPRQV